MLHSLPYVQLLTVFFTSLQIHTFKAAGALALALFCGNVTDQDRQKLEAGRANP